MNIEYPAWLSLESKNDCDYFLNSSNIKLQYACLWVKKFFDIIDKPVDSSTQIYSFQIDPLASTLSAEAQKYQPQDVNIELELFATVEAVILCSMQMLDSLIKFADSLIGFFEYYKIMINNNYKKTQTLENFIEIISKLQREGHITFDQLKLVEIINEIKVSPHYNKLKIYRYISTHMGYIKMDQKLSRTGIGSTVTKWDDIILPDPEALTHHNFLYIEQISAKNFLKELLSKITDWHDKILSAVQEDIKNY